MPKFEKAIHLAAFKLYMEYGATTPEFLSSFEKQTGKSAKTAYRWAQDFNWKERARKPIDEAVQQLEESQKLNAEELISGLLGLAKERMDGLSEQVTEIKSILASAFNKGKDQKPLLKARSISELAELVRAESRLIRDEQAYIRLVLTLVGKPEQIMEDRMIVQFVGAPKGFLDDDFSDTDAADIPEAD